MEAFRLPVRQAKGARRLYQSSICAHCTQSRRLLSTQPSARTDNDLEENPSLLFGTTTADPTTYDPVGKAKGRKYQLPPSRYCAFSRVSIPPSSHLTDTNSAHLVTTADLYIPISHRQHTTQPPASSSPDHSPTRDYNKPTNASSRPTS